MSAASADDSLSLPAPVACCFENPSDFRRHLSGATANANRPFQRGGGVGQPVPMRDLTDGSMVRSVMEYLGQRVKGPGRVYLVGGTSAVLLGWREHTIDVDLALQPEPRGIFDVIKQAKEALGVNIEVAAPDHFIPALPDWEGRSPFICRCGRIDYFHYDFYSQALSKLCRSHRCDLEDVRAMHRQGLVGPAELLRFFEQIEPRLKLYTQVHEKNFRVRVHEMVRELEQ